MVEDGDERACRVRACGDAEGGGRAGGASASLEFGRASSGVRACSFQAVAEADILAGVSLGMFNLRSVPKDRGGDKMLGDLAPSSFSMFTPADPRPGVGREHLVTEADGGSGMVAGTEA